MQRPRPAILVLTRSHAACHFVPSFSPFTFVSLTASATPAIAVNAGAAPAGAAFGAPVAPVAAVGTAPVPTFGNAPNAVRFNAAGMQLSF